MMNEGNLITKFLKKNIFTQENLWAVLLAGILILVFICGTIGIQPEFVYTGF